MISVMNDFQIDRNPASAHDLSFFGMESPEEEERMESIAQEIHLLPLESQGPKETRRRVSPAEENQQQRSPPRDSEPDTAPELDDEEPVDLKGFTTGDMVWGKVKSHPWWPGHIFKESFATPSVQRMKRDDNVLVAFFGDSSYGWFDPAELISFEQHFVEKSRQTNLRSFVRAVEESIDETGRRAALGIACRCQNPYNFRPKEGTKNYYYVDVVGYERKGIYSRRQINRERETFDGKGVINFLQKLAVMPTGSETKDVAWHRTVALALAVRRRRFEEFDETYAQAFGQTPVRPAVNEMGVPEQAESFTPRGLPLSGPLVVPEALSRKQTAKHASSAFSSSSHKHKGKEKSPKKNKYVLKRRYERHVAASTLSAPLPDAFFIPTDSAAATGGSSEFLLQKRELAAGGDKPDEDGSTPDAESPQTPPMPADPENDANEQPASYAAPAPLDVSVAKKEKKIKKRSLDDVGGQEEAKTEKKKRKKKKDRDGGLGQDAPSVHKKTSSASPDEVSRASETSISPPRPVSPQNADLGPLDRLELPHLLADLHSLALDPFFGTARNAPSITRHVLGKFRSLVYSKSLFVPAPGEIDAQGQEVQASKPPAAPSITPPSVKDAKLMKRAADPTKAGRKRAPSDRHEEILAKRTKKVNRLKSLASEKRAALNPNASPEAPKADNGTATATATAMDASGPSTVVEPAKRPEKQEQLPPPTPKRECQAFLVMKFPPRSTLPSVSHLKARFARFGPLEVVGTRVFWKSHSCRVQFKHMSDAERALSYLKSNNIFGQMQVEYTVREVDGPALEPASEHSNLGLDPHADGSLQFMPGNSGRSQPRPQQPHGRLKSILKKPGDEAAKSQRVKFMLSGNDSPPSASGNGVGFADVARPHSPPASSASVQHHPPPQTQTTLLAPPVRSNEPRWPPQLIPPAIRPVENRAPPAVQFSERPPLRWQEQGSRNEMVGKKRNNNVDISHQMLSLLLRCNDIVTGLRALPDFLPYRPL